MHAYHYDGVVTESEHAKYYSHHSCDVAEDEATLHAMYSSVYMISLHAKVLMHQFLFSISDHWNSASMFRLYPVFIGCDDEADYWFSSIW
jgi:hypothetical protein